MAKRAIKIKGSKEFNKAIVRSPRVVRREYSRYLTRGLAVLNREIRRPPWRVGASNGGIPVAEVDGGNLRQAHRTLRTAVLGRIYVDPSAAKYGIYVHEGTTFMKERPWMDTALKNRKKDLEKLQDKMHKNIVKELAK